MGSLALSSTVMLRSVTVTDGRDIRNKIKATCLRHVVDIAMDIKSGSRGAREEREVEKDLKFKKPLG